MNDTDRFDEALAALDRGEPWRFREPDAPNPLVIEATGWEEGNTRLGPAEFLVGVDRDGKRWSVLVGGVVLRKRLIEGVVEEYREGRFVVDHVEGRVEPREVVAIRFKGDRAGPTYDYPDFDVVRRKPAATSEGGALDDGIPY